MEKEILYEKIEQFISDEMSAQERLDFEKKIESDATLSEEVALHRALHESMKDTKSNDFLKTLESVNTAWEAPQQQGRVFKMSMRYWMAVAAIFIGVIASVFVFNKSETQTDYYASNFEPYDMVLSYRGDTENALLESAINAYNTKGFLAAEAEFMALSEAHPDNTAYPFYVAMSQLAGGKNQSNFISIFTQIAENEGHVFQKQARWYQAMSYFYVGENVQAKQTLGLIKEGDFKYKEAQDLLKELN